MLQIGHKGSKDILHQSLENPYNFPGEQSRVLPDVSDVRMSSLLLFEFILLCAVFFLAVGRLKSEWETLHLFLTVGITEDAHYYMAWESSWILKKCVC